MTEIDAYLAASLSRRFRLIRQLGQGGMGAVFLAEQIAVGNRPVALKVLNRKLLDDPEFLQRFQNEAASTGRIHHVNVVTIYESGQADDGTPYIAMEFLEGESLRQALSRRGAFPAAEVAEILQQAARGLNAAHKLGIIHRDLKPDNIFLTHSDDDSVAPVSPPASSVSPPSNLQVKIVDFGIAKLRESGAHTQTGTLLGTPAYMSFEQASGMRSDELDARSDIYSLGVVVYEMLTARTPFQSDTPVGYLRKHLQDAPPPFRSLVPNLGVPPAVESAVMKALGKDRNQRYASALDFARALTRAAHPSPQAEVPVALTSTRIVSPPAVAKPPQSRAAPKPHSKMKFVASAVVALVFIVAGVWYFSQHGVNRGDTSLSGKARESKGEARVNPKDGLKYVWIPPGTFMMGCSPGDNECSDDEKPPHQVTITRGFWLGQTEVTVGAYKRFAGATGTQMPPEPDIDGRPVNPGWREDAMPIANVSWDDAQAYCSWAGERLPTEAEWEYAARAGGTGSRYGDVDEIAWYANNSGRQRLDMERIFKEDFTNSGKRLNENGNGMHEVGQKRPNGFGLFDMLGNVDEWVNDFYTDPYPGESQYYKNSPSQDPTGPASRGHRALRGGSWSLPASSARVSQRNHRGSDFRYYGLGFRCGGTVITLAEPPGTVSPGATRSQGSTSGQVRENTKDGLKYVQIPSGTFMMGCSPGDNKCIGVEKPSHQVTISKGFWIGQTEVTVGGYKRFAAATGRQMPPEPNSPPRLNSGWRDETMPIVDVNWDDAQAYCRWAGGRLPTEAEWEYAARAGSTAPRYGDVDEIAWYGDNSGRQRLDSERIWEKHVNNSIRMFLLNPHKKLRDEYGERMNENGNGMHEVGKKRANGFGLFDMLGNVWEWVNDWSDNVLDNSQYYEHSPSQDPAGAASGTKRVLRGGSGKGAPSLLRVSFRYSGDPASRDVDVGFRCAREVDTP